MNVSEALDAAADRLESEGWLGGHENPESEADKDNAACAQVAISRVARPGYSAGGAIFALARALGSKTPFLDLGAIWDWNDAPGRTKEEVLTKLKEVANEHR